MKKTMKEEMVFYDYYCDVLTKWQLGLGYQHILEFHDLLIFTLLYIF